MIHVGVDLVSLTKIKRILDANSSSAFVKRICTLQEIQSLETVVRKVERVAAFFGLKEAFSKAIGTGIGAELSFQDMEISYTLKGQPLIAYRGKNKTLESLGNQVSCSVSHQDSMLVAFVVIEGNLEGNL